MKVFAIIVLVLVAGIAAAQCSGPNCPVPTFAPQQRAERVTVSRISATEFCVNVDGVQVGNFDLNAKTFRLYEAQLDTWGDVQSWEGVGKQSDWREHGVDKSKLRSSTGDNIEIPNDSKKLRVTVVGTKEQRKEVVAALQGEDVSLWQCDPDHWSLTDTETGKRIFKTDGSPTVYVQTPDGKVLHRQDDARDVVSAIRKATKGYQSSLDPDLRKPVAPPVQPLDSPSSLPGIVMAAGVVFAMFRKRLLGA